EAAGPVCGDALHESGAGDGAGGSDSSAANERRDVRNDDEARGEAGEKTGGGERRAGVCFEPGADAVDQRGGLLRHGRRGDGGSCGRGDEAGDESSDGAAGAGGFYWARCVRGYHARSARRAGRSEVSCVSAAEEICGGGMAGAEIRTG